MIAYVETSAFVKLLVDERGSEEAAALWQAASHVVSSVLLYPEARAALAAASRAGRLRARPLADARAELESLWLDVDAVEVTPELAELAGELAEAYGLRGYDAVHLASLQQLAGEEAVLISADQDLVTAAEARGFRSAAIAA